MLGGSVTEKNTYFRKKVLEQSARYLENGSGRDEPVICSPRSALAAAGSSNTGALDVASRVLPCGKFGIMICITCNTPSWWSGQAHPITENMLAVKSLKSI